MKWPEAGWQRFRPDLVTSAWVTDVREAALRTAADPAQRAKWLRHGGTWFVGVDALDNDAVGRVADGLPFGGIAFGRAAQLTGVAALHKAQISITYPGYPQQGPSDTTAAHRFRVSRDSAHLDGLLGEGPEKRRHLREPHAWILGVALTEADPGAAPLVVWEGSHRIIRNACDAAFAGTVSEQWGDIDLTDAYRTARAQVFETCSRVEVPLVRGETVLLHRHLIHGVAPWKDGARAEPSGRAIAYFRPCFDHPADWLRAP